MWPLRFRLLSTLVVSPHRARRWHPLGTSLHMSPPCASSVPRVLVFGAVYCGKWVKQRACESARVLNDAGGTGGRSEAGGTEQPVWLCLGLLPRR